MGCVKFTAKDAAKPPNAMDSKRPALACCFSPPLLVANNTTMTDGLIYKMGYTTTAKQLVPV
jgi:hypothetical protein